MRRWSETAYARWLGLVAAALAVAGTSIALASTDREAASSIAPAGYSKQ